ncbi:MAG: S41 family peptidase [Rikenellaceae bacterium]|nr:S41 family peptidase [Rikenellaceae bacterium]
MKIFTGIILFITIFGSTKQVLSQELSIYSMKFVPEVLYSIPMEEYPDARFSFSIGNKEEKGIEPITWQKTTHDFLNSKKCYFWNEELGHPLIIDKRSTTVQTKTYTERVNNYEIFLVCSDGQILSHRFVIDNDGPQMSISRKIPEFSDNTISDTICVKEILLKVDPHSEDFVFIISELRILQNGAPIKTEVINPFFNIVTGNKNNYSQKLNDDDRYILTHDTSFGKAESGNFYIEVKDGGTWNNNELVLHTFDKILNYYPYYDQYFLDKETALEKFEKLRKESLSYESLADSLELLVSLFRDPHFRVLSLPSGNKKSSSGRKPLELFMFDNIRYVSAVFDTTIKSIHPGDIFLYNICYNEEFYGERDSRGNSMSGWQDSIMVATLAGSDTVITRFKYEEQNIDVPKNFIPLQNDLKIYESTLYLKINTLDDESYYLLIKGIKQYDPKGIIIDLRGCGGGNSYLAENILAHFINKPAITGHKEFVGLNGYKETRVIKPDINSMDIPICLLVNRQTACAAELLCHLLRSHAGAVVVGNSATAGTLATIHDLHFPEGFTLRFNSILVSTPYPEIDLNKKGLVPDIYVSTTQVKHLFPYDDKILNTALQYIKGFQCN